MSSVVPMTSMTSMSAVSSVISSVVSMTSMATGVSVAAGSRSSSLSGGIGASARTNRFLTTMAIARFLHRESSCHRDGNGNSEDGSESREFHDLNLGADKM